MKMLSLILIIIAYINVNNAIPPFDNNSIMDLTIPSTTTFEPIINTASTTIAPPHSVTKGYLFKRLHALLIGAFIGSGICILYLIIGCFWYKRSASKWKTKMKNEPMLIQNETTTNEMVESVTFNLDDTYAS